MHSYLIFIMPSRSVFGLLSVREPDPNEPFPSSPPTGAYDDEADDDEEAADDGDDLPQMPSSPNAGIANNTMDPSGDNILPSTELEDAAIAIAERFIQRNDLDHIMTDVDGEHLQAHSPSADLNPDETVVKSDLEDEPDFVEGSFDDCDEPANAPSSPEPGRSASADGTSHYVRIPDCFSDVRSEVER